MTLSRIWGPLTCLAVAALYLPTGLWLAEAWPGNPYYSHGPLVILGAVYLVWARRKLLRKPQRLTKSQLLTKLPPDAPEVSNRQRYAGFALICLGIVIHILSLPWRAYWISALTLPVVLSGFLIFWRGAAVARSFAFPLFFLVLAIPIPIVEYVGPPLQALATDASVSLARLTGLNVVNIGSEITLPDISSTFVVGIPCGGLRSLIALLTLACATLYIFKGPAIGQAMLLLAAVPIALAANVVRLVVLLAISAHWGADAGMNYFHDWSSPVLFIAALGILLFTARMLRCTTIAWERVAP